MQTEELLYTAIGSLAAVVVYVYKQLHAEIKAGKRACEEDRERLLMLERIVYSGKCEREQCPLKLDKLS